MRLRKATRRPCHCPAYHYPHRYGSGLCGNQEAQNLLLYGPPPEDDKTGTDQ